MGDFREFSITNMTGSYRRVFQKPVDFEWYALVVCEMKITTIDFQIQLYTQSFLFHFCRELLEYTDGDIPLVETDLDKIADYKPLKMVRVEDPADGNEDKIDCVKQAVRVEDDDEAEDAGEECLPNIESNSQKAQMALKLSFTLPSSCYATMAIRELLKTSTSVCTSLQVFISANVPLYITTL